jgi:hypothetical protein
MIDKNNMATEDLSDFLPPQPAPEAASKRMFMPWHKPRKQYIRRKQWVAEITKLIRVSHFPQENKVFRYLTLPSEDMLDIRVLEDSLKNTGLKLKYLGYCNTHPGHPDDIRMNLSENEIKGLAQVDATSLVVRDRLEMTGIPTSQAYRKLHDNGPYHAVNIDLCGHFSAPRQDRVNACIDAIKSIAELQVMKSTQGWLFFLTTRFQPGYVDLDHLKAFVAVIQENIERSPAFSQRIQSIFTEEGMGLIHKHEDVVNMGTADFRKFFCIGFGKWLLAFLADATPKTKVEMLPGYYYSIGENGQEMLSLAFKCTPNIISPRDRFNLVPALVDVPLEVIDEVQLAIQIADSTSNLKDLDAFLGNDSDLMEKMIKDSIQFLQQASYDISGYRDFVNSSTS